MQAVRQQRPLSLIMLDVDGFKQINDGQGHLAGDVLLQDISRLIAARLRQTDLFGRYGGDEFSRRRPPTRRCSWPGICARGWLNSWR